MLYNRLIPEDVIFSAWTTNIAVTNDGPHFDAQGNSDIVTYINNLTN
jgi:hypothetical protein